MPILYGGTFFCLCSESEKERERGKVCGNDICVRESHGTPVESAGSPLKNCTFTLSWKQEVLFSWPKKNRVKRFNIFFQSDLVKHYMNVYEIKFICIMKKDTVQYITIIGNKDKFNDIWFINNYWILISLLILLMSLIIFPSWHIYLHFNKRKRIIRCYRYWYIRQALKININNLSIFYCN